MGKRGLKSRRGGNSPPRAKYQVFVSHATADKWVAERICEAIERCKAFAFIDNRDIETGDEIPEEIRLAIAACNEFVLLLTPMSVSRDWVKLELGAAWALKKRIIIVTHYLEADQLPATFKPRKVVKLNDLADYLKELATRAKENSQ